MTYILKVIEELQRTSFKCLEDYATLRDNCTAGLKIKCRRGLNDELDYPIFFLLRGFLILQAQYPLLYLYWIATELSLMKNVPPIINYLDVLSLAILVSTL